MEALWEKLLFWKKKPKMFKESVDYHFINLNDGELTGIALSVEGYEDVIYHYHKAKIVEEGELARLQFGYTIVHPGNHNVDDLTNDEKLHTIMGDILTNILTAQSNEQIRTDYSKELNL
mgnify:FL=1